MGEGAFGEGYLARESEGLQRRVAAGDDLHHDLDSAPLLLKLLQRYEDQLEAQDVAAELEAVGIPAYVSATSSHLFGRIQSGALKVTVWIALNHQFEDAKAYLKDPAHVVTTGLSEDEFNEIREQTSDFAFQFFNRVLLGAGVLLAVLAFLAWWYLSNYVETGGVR